MKTRQTPTSCEIDLFLKACLVDQNPLHAHAYRPARYLKIKSLKKIKSVRWYTYHVDAHYAWERTFRAGHVPGLL